MKTRMSFLPVSPCRVIVRPLLFLLFCELGYRDNGEVLSVVCNVVMFY